MRALIGVSILVLLTIILSIGGYYLISYYSNNIITDLNDLEKASLNNDWAKASLINKKLDNNWGRAQSILPALIDHAELHDLEIFMAHKSVLIEENQKKELLMEISSAKELIKNIPSQQKLSIRNIL